MADYKLKFTAAEIDEKLSSISNKQDKLIGTQGQVVGFDVDGNAVAQEAVTSWNDLTDKPFGETATGGDTIYMPDDLSRLESVETSQGTMYKISNITPTIAELESTDYLHPGNEGIIRDVDGNEATYYIMSEADNWAAVSSNGPANTSIIIAYKDNATTNFGVLPSSGIYAPSYGATCTGFASLTITGFTDFPDIKKLDSKYLDFNIDDYKNAILLDGESLKNTSGEDITEDVKAAVNTWGINSVKLQIPKNCYSIAYGNGKFVSAQYGSTALIYSTDGIHWNETNQVTTRNENWSSIAYGNNIFIAISNGVTTAYSVDGINWNTYSMSNAFDFPSVAYGNGVFVLVGKYSSYNSYGMLYSTDGINWTKGNNYDSRTNWNSVTYGNSMFVAVASSNVVMYSTDGINWNTASIPFGIWNSVTYGNGMFVATAALSSNIAYSVDGINWSTCDDAVISLSSAYLTTYGNGTFIAIGNDNSDDNSNGVFLYSTDGTTWNSSTLNYSDSLGDWMSVTYGNGMFVAINTSGICAHSTNGINWTTELKAIETASGQDITNDIKSIVTPTEMTGSTSSTAGTSGLVPAPAAGDENKFLKGDGTWGEVEAGNNILYIDVLDDEIHINKNYNEIVEAFNAGKKCVLRYEGIDFILKEVKSDNRLDFIYIDISQFRLYRFRVTGDVFSGIDDYPILTAYSDINADYITDGTVALDRLPMNEIIETVGGKTSCITVTLSASSWTEQSDGSYAQTVSVTGVTADNSNAVDCALTGSDKDANIAILQGWGCVNDCKQSAGTLTFYCYGDKPTVNIPINVVVM